VSFEPRPHGSLFEKSCLVRACVKQTLPREVTCICCVLLVRSRCITYSSITLIFISCNKCGVYCATKFENRLFLVPDYATVRDTSDTRDERSVRQCTKTRFRNVREMFDAEGLSRGIIEDRSQDRGRHDDQNSRGSPIGRDEEG